MSTKKTKKNFTKEQIAEAAKEVLQIAHNNGYLDDICQSGQDAVTKLSEMVGMESELNEEKSVCLKLVGEVNMPKFANVYDSTGDFEVEVKYKGKVISGFTVDEVDDY